MLKQIKLSGFKSIREMDLQLSNLNVLIGPNGAGKTNFISFFELMRAAFTGNIDYYVTKNGGANSLLHYGSKITKQLNFSFEYQTSGESKYAYCILESTVDDTLFKTMLGLSNSLSKVEARNGSERKMSKTYLVRTNEEKKIFKFARHELEAFIDECWIYHLHDTSAQAQMRLTGDLEDNVFLQPDGSNLAAYLFMLKNTHAAVYQRIISTIRRIAPFFEEFVLEPPRANPNTIRLRWREKGSEQIFGAHQLSDGTLRTMALVTMLHQPVMPGLILVDEPELGLHPYALSILASLIKSASKKTQIILSTQSVSLVNHFDIEDLVVVERKDGQSVFERKDKEEFKDWLTEYSVGQLWEMNVLGGRPS